MCHNCIAIVEQCLLWHSPNYTYAQHNLIMHAWRLFVQAHHQVAPGLDQSHFRPLSRAATGRRAHIIVKHL